jgi:hypothetical protein
VAHGSIPLRMRLAAPPCRRRVTFATSGACFGYLCGGSACLLLLCTHSRCIFHRGVAHTPRARRTATRTHRNAHSENIHETRSGAGIPRGPWAGTGIRRVLWNACGGGEQQRAAALGAHQNRGRLSGQSTLVLISRIMGSTVASSNGMSHLVSTSRSPCSVAAPPSRRWQSETLTLPRTDAGIGAEPLPVVGTCRTRTAWRSPCRSV